MSYSRKPENNSLFSTSSGTPNTPLTEEEQRILEKMKQELLDRLEVLDKDLKEWLKKNVEEDKKRAYPTGFGR